MKFKKTIIVIVAVFVVLILGCIIAINIIGGNLKKFGNSNIKAVNLNNLNNGEYIGSFEIFPIKVKTKTIIRDNRIITIEILEHISGQGEPAEAIVKDIIDKQRIDVDVITGATYSSKAIQKSIENALTR